MNANWKQAYPGYADEIQEIIISQEQIQAKVQALGKAISQDYLGRNLLLVGVLKGVLFFFADLLREISIPVEMDFIAVSSYSSESRDQGYVRLVKDLDIPIHHRHILFVEDVIDTGLTLNYILQNLRSRQPASLEVCALFNKPDHRLIDIPLRYKGFDLPDKFVVGYGLDFKEKFRNLPFIGLLKASTIQNRVNPES
jgi:hypoxanthine phosphoribosyltransferase